MAGSNSFLSRIPAVTKNLIIINILVWLAMLIVPGKLGIDMERYGAMHYFTSPWFNPAQLITYMFMHSTHGLTHIFFNMFALFMFGSVLERVLGPKRFLFYYISTGVGAALIQSGVYAIWLGRLTSGIPAGELDNIIAEGAVAISKGMNFVNPALAEINMLVNGATLGASGAVFGVLLAFGMIFPNMPMYLLFIPVPIKAKWMVIGYGVLELFFGITGVQSGVAHFAHLGGMAVGFIIIWYWRKKGLFDNYGPFY